MQAVQLIEQRIGLSAAAQYRADIDNVLYNLAGGDVRALLHTLQNTHETDREWQALIEAITIGETYFLRDRTHFDILKAQILPQIILQRRKQNRLALYIWSMGCATGEETYSIAILLNELLPDINRWTIYLFGTDINNRALHLARAGVYRQWAFRHTGEAFQRQYFDPVSGGLRIKGPIQQMPSFRFANALDAPPLPQFDIILSRNVLLYFSRQAIRHVESLLYEALVPSGWLILGQAEAIRYERERWVTHIFPGTAIYQKAANRATLVGGTVTYQPAPAQVVDATPLRATTDATSGSYEEAVAALQNEHYEVAEQILARLLSGQPRNPRVHTLLAFLFANRQALPEARAHLDLALKIEPLLADAHYVQALIQMEEDAVADSLKSLQAALYCRRDYALAAFMLGNIHAQQGRLPKAHQHWQKALRAIQHLPDDATLADVSDMRAGQLRALIAQNLDL